jgi:hypothetical protein
VRRLPRLRGPGAAGRRRLPATAAARRAGRVRRGAGHPARRVARLPPVHHLVDHDLHQRRDAAGRGGRDRRPARRRPLLPDQARPRPVRDRGPHPGVPRAAQRDRDLAGRVLYRPPRRGGAAVRRRGGRGRGRRRGHPPGRGRAAPAAAVPGLPGRRAADVPHRARPRARPELAGTAHRHATAGPAGVRGPGQRRPGRGLAGHLRGRAGRAGGAAVLRADGRRQARPAGDSGFYGAYYRAGAGSWPATAAAAACPG